MKSLEQSQQGNIQKPEEQILTSMRSVHPMKAKFLVMAIAFLDVLLAPAWGADITGTWKGSMDMMGQPIELTFNFKADGNTFTGTTVGPGGNESPISNGKIDGEKISFTVKTTGKMEMTINYKGTYSGDEMKLTMQFDMSGMGGGPGGGGPGGGMGGPPELVLKKVY
jgi:hypothetical protein